MRCLTERSMKFVSLTHSKTDTKLMCPQVLTARDIQALGSRENTARRCHTRATLSLASDARAPLAITPAYSLGLRKSGAVEPRMHDTCSARATDCRTVARR